MPANRLFITCCIALAIVLAGIALLLPAILIQPELKEAVSSQPARDRNLFQQKTEKPSVKEIVRNALEGERVEDCNGGGEREEILQFSLENCGGTIDEKIFCISFLKQKAEYCGWIESYWYSTTCRAVDGGDTAECNRIKNSGNRALCVSEFARNVQGAECGFEEPDWREFCTAQSDLNAGRYILIEEESLRRQCAEIIGWELEQAEGG